jgi:hypothetical protein
LTWAHTGRISNPIHIASSFPRVFNPLTREEVFYERLERYQFPLFNEVLDEIDIVTLPLAGLT